MSINSRRNFLRLSALTAGAIGISSTGFSMPDFLTTKISATPGTAETYPFKLPSLGYLTDELEPFIDAKTMEIHYKKHHQGYVDKLNAAMAKFPDQQSKNLETLFAQINTLPDELAKAIRNNGGGHYNHSLFWKIMTPEKNTQASPELTKAINDSFSNMDNFKTEMNKAAMGVFGSGWAWLVKDDSHKLSVISSPNQESPLMADAKAKGTPILGIDVWEHAYYLKHQNVRADYLVDIWNVINWKQVSDNFAG